MRSQNYEQALDQACDELSKPENRENFKAMLTQYDSLVKQVNGILEDAELPYWCYCWCGKGENKV